jgi:phage tail-like protein
MALGLIQPVPNFNFTITMWDVPVEPATGKSALGETLTSAASAALDLLGTTIFGAFSEAQGIDSDLEIETYQEGGLNRQPHRFFKSTKYQNLVLKKGITSNAAIWDWHNQIVSNKKKVRKSGVLVLYERGGLNLVGAGLPGLDRTPAAIWMFNNGLPERVHGPTLNAKGNEIAIETLEISHEGLQRVSPSMIPGLSDINAALGDLVGLGAAGAGAAAAATSLP